MSVLVLSKGDQHSMYVQCYWYKPSETYHYWGIVVFKQDYQDIVPAGTLVCPKTKKPNNKGPVVIGPVVYDSDPDNTRWGHRVYSVCRNP